MKSMRILIVTLLLLGQSAFAGEHAAEGPTLYERLGTWDGINQIVSDTIAYHVENEAIAHYFEDVDLEKLQGHVTAFFAAGTGGPNQYEGRDMTSTHAAMNMSEADFDAAVADVLKAVKANGKDESVQAEVKAILYSLKPAVMGTAGS